MNNSNANATRIMEASAAVVRQDYSRVYLTYVLIVLVLVQTLGFVDRQLLTILVEPIKREFGVSDTAMGLLTGAAFSLFYVTLSVPIARLADRRSRRNILSLAIALWSVFTALCGAAAHFWQLALARIGVGVGEAGGGPPAFSMLSDYFPPRLRSTALSIYTTGAHFGVLLSMLGGAFIASHYGWRAAFLVLGVPGLLVALLLWRTVDEPLRGRWDAAPAPAPASAAPGVFAALKAFWANRPIRCTALAAGFTAMSGFGFSTWLPSFAMRVHGLSLIDTGVILGLTSVAGGFVGSICGGLCTDWLAQRNPRWQLGVAGVALWLSLPLQLAITLWPAGHFLQLGGFGVPIAFCFMPFSAFFSSFWMGPAYAAVNNLVAPGERAQASACMMLVINILGSCAGPLLVGLLSDAFAPGFAALAIRYALLCSLASVVVGALLFWRAGSLYRAALAQRA